MIIYNYFGGHVLNLGERLLFFCETEFHYLEKFYIWAYMLCLEYFVVKT